MGSLTLVSSGYDLSFFFFLELSSSSWVNVLIIWFCFIEANLFSMFLLTLIQRMRKFPWICFKVASVYWWQTMRWGTFSFSYWEQVSSQARKKIIRYAICNTIICEFIERVYIYKWLYWFPMLQVRISVSSTTILYYYTGCFLLTQTLIYNNKKLSAFFSKW